MSFLNRAVSRFALLAVVLMVVCTLAWSFVSGVFALPLAWVGSWVLESLASGWINHVDIVPLKELVLDTSVAVSSEQTGWRKADVILEINPSRYAYSFPILVALVVALRATGWGLRLVWGYLLLLPFQLFSLCVLALFQICSAAGFDASVLDVAQWQVESIVYVYQMGSLMVPVVSPFLIWVWLDWETIRVRFLHVAPVAAV